jgi:hypothetical protein
MLVKVFAEIHYEQLETTVQNWLNANPAVHIHHIAQSQRDISYVNLTIFYTR